MPYHEYELADGIALLEDICIPTNSHEFNSMYRLIYHTYSNFLLQFGDVEYVIEHTMLAPTNKGINEKNAIPSMLFLGSQTIHLSANFVLIEDYQNAALYPTEILNSLTLGDMPQYKLVLKVGLPVILLQNLAPVQRLCTGTRLIIRGFQGFVLDAKIVAGDHIGKCIMISYITLIPTESNCPISFKSCQFPIRLAFGMIINKAQRQSLEFVGFYLHQLYFTHSQLYVAMLRVRKKINLKCVVSFVKCLNN